MGMTTTMTAMMKTERTHPSSSSNVLTAGVAILQWLARYPKVGMIITLTIVCQCSSVFL
jgi:hypothetical protein